MAKKNSDSIGLDDEWRVEEDARTLLRAAEIRADKARLKKAQAWAKKRATELAGITSITD